MLYSIGDVHGRLDLLKELHGYIMEDSAKKDGQHTIVMLGDYIDRGPQSNEVIDFLMDEPFDGFEHVYLCGNHEDMFISAFEEQDDMYGDIWINNGGKATLESFGYSKHEYFTMRSTLKRSLSEYIEWTKNLKLYHKTDDYLFVHAGIHPHLYQNEYLDEHNGDHISTFDNETKQYMLWIRDLFLESNMEYEFRVIHGHTPTNGIPDIKHNRINLDTYAYGSGILTAAVIEPGNPSVNFLLTGQT